LGICTELNRITSETATFSWMELDNGELKSLRVAGHISGPHDT